MPTKYFSRNVSKNQFRGILTTYNIVAYARIHRPRLAVRNVHIARSAFSLIFIPVVAVASRQRTAPQIYYSARAKLRNDYADDRISVWRLFNAAAFSGRNPIGLRNKAASGTRPKFQLIHETAKFGQGILTRIFRFFFSERRLKTTSAYQQYLRCVD